LKRFRCVAPGDEAWRAGPELLSFVDVLKHLGDADEWLLDRLRGGDAAHTEVRPGDASPQEWPAQFDRFVELGRQRTVLIRSLTPARLAQPIVDPEVLGPTTVRFLILRGGLDHEIHHRGALQLMLRLRYHRVEPRR
jgi:hypothetical protein